MKVRAAVLHGLALFYAISKFGWEFGWEERRREKRVGWGERRTGVIRNIQGIERRALITIGNSNCILLRMYW